MRKRAIPFAVALLLVMVGCSSSDPTASDEYTALEQELAVANQEITELESQLAEITAEGAGSAAERYRKATVNQETLLAIIKDPSAFGSEQEVLDLIDVMATPDVVSGDLAFGGAMTGIWRQGWRNTLFSGVDATIHTWRS